MIDIYVINLNKRPDRWEQIKKSFAYPNLNLIRVEAVEEKRGWVGCFKSHKKCIQIAKDKELPYIIVMEDDCIPFDNTDFIDRFIKMIEYLDTNNDWNIVIGSTATITPNSFDNVIQFAENNYFVEFTRAYMAHLIFYNQNVYDLYLNEQITRPVDEFWFGKIKALIPVPFIAKQLPGFSNIINKDKSDEKRTQEANSLLKIHLLRTLNKKK